MTDDIVPDTDSLKHQTQSPSGVNWVRLLNIVGPVLALLAVYAFFAVFVPSFRYADNIPNIARQTTPVAVAALGMTLVIISAGIDLSVGSLVALGSVVIAWLLEYGHMDPLVAAVGGIAVCALFGMLSGLIITGLRVVPFIVTLGMMLLVRGIAMFIAREQKIDTPYTWLTELMAVLPPERRWMWFPPGVWIAIVLAIIVAVMLRYTRLGRHVFAVGSNEMTARLCGVSVSLIKVIVFTLSGAFAGVASLMYFSRLTVGDPSGVRCYRRSRYRGRKPLGR